jgi:hypothetical protein
MLWLVIFLAVAKVSSLRIEDVTFPGYAMLGQTVTMVCDYSLAQDELVDSIKWYKDNNEFYRIIPNAPSVQDRVIHFRRPGIKLDIQKSGVR